MKQQDGKFDAHRRTVLKGALSGIAVVAVAGALPVRQAAAAHHEKVKLDETDPKATALGYKHDATQVDTGKFPKRSGDAGAKQFCSNCNLYAEVEGGWGKCSIFPGQHVSGKGWCNAWVGQV
jgi:hypothetical protein